MANGAAEWGVGMLRVPASDQHRQGAHWPEECQRGGSGACPPRHLPADEGHVHRIGAGRHLRQGVGGGELLARHPVVYLDHVAVHLREHRGGAANRQKRQHQEIQKQPENVRVLHQFCPFQAATRANGTSRPMTTGSGQRRTPTPVKASTPNSQVYQCRGRTVASRTPLASSNPAATADIPVSACCTSTSPP